MAKQIINLKFTLIDDGILAISFFIAVIFIKSSLNEFKWNVGTFFSELNWDASRVQENREGNEAEAMRC